MPTAEQQSDLLQAIEHVRDAQRIIKRQIEIAADTESLIALNKQLQSLDRIISWLNHAQNAAHDDDFTATAKELKGKTAQLKKDAEKMKAFIDAVEKAADFVNHITQALGFIAKL
jgi:DNA mismatch repair ATPase MutS